MCTENVMLVSPVVCKISCGQVHTKHRHLQKHMTKHMIPFRVTPVQDNDIEKKWYYSILEICCTSITWCLKKTPIWRRSVRKPNTTITQLLVSSVSPALLVESSLIFSGFLWANTEESSASFTNNETIWTAKGKVQRKIEVHHCQAQSNCCNCPFPLTSE